MRPDTQYARCGEIYIAYQVLGAGPLDLVVSPGLISNIEFGWQNPDWVAFHLGLASFARVILFDKRGTGVSDRIIGAATLEERMGDVRAVMDAAGWERAALYGSADSAALVVLVAATYPERAPALVLWGPRVRERVGTRLSVGHRGTNDAVERSPLREPGACRAEHRNADTEQGRRPRVRAPRRVLLASLGHADDRSGTA